MIINPIISLPLMIVITILLVIGIIKISKKEVLIVRLLIVAVLFLINLRIMTPSGEIEVEHNSLDIVFVIDTTISMEARDYYGGDTRLNGVKNDVLYILEQIPGMNYSVITFDHNTALKVPFTTDPSAVKSSIESLITPNTLYARGTSVTLFKEELKRVLNNSYKKNDHVRIVFIFSDGENTTNDDVESLMSLRNLVDGGAVFGYGTETGAKMIAKNSLGEEETVQDKTSYPYKDAISKLDEKNLMKMSNELNIGYVNMNNRPNIESLLNTVQRKNSTSSVSLEYTYQDIYYYFSPFLILLFFVELYLDRRRFI